MIPNLCLDLKLDHGKGVKKMDKQTDKLTSADFNIDSTSLDMSKLDHYEIGFKFEKRRGMFFIIVIIPEKLFLYLIFEM